MRTILIGKALIMRGFVHPPSGRLMSTTIRQQDLIDSVAAALQYISYYHPADYIAHLARAYEIFQKAFELELSCCLLTRQEELRRHLP